MPEHQHLNFAIAHKKDKKYSKKSQKILLIWPECMLQEQEEQGLNFDQL